MISVTSDIIAVT